MHRWSKSSTGQHWTRVLWCRVGVNSTLDAAGRTLSRDNGKLASPCKRGCDGIFIRVWLKVLPLINYRVCTPSIYTLVGKWRLQETRVECTIIHTHELSGLFSKSMSWLLVLRPSFCKNFFCCRITASIRVFLGGTGRVCIQFKASSNLLFVRWQKSVWC